MHFFIFCMTIEANNVQLLAKVSGLKKDNPGCKVGELGNLTKKYLDLIELFLRDLLWLKLDRKIVNDLYRYRYCENI